MHYIANTGTHMGSITVDIVWQKITFKMAIVMLMLAMSIYFKMYWVCGEYKECNFYVREYYF